KALDLGVLNNLKPGAEADDDAAFDGFVGLREYVVRGLGRMVGRKRSKHNVQLVKAPAGKQVVERFEVPVLRGHFVDHVEDQGFQKVLLGAGPKRVAAHLSDPGDGSVGDDHFGKEL